MASVTGKPHDNGSCDSIRVKRQVIICKRCGEQPLVWHRCNVVGEGHHAMYLARKTGYKSWDADTLQPHVCSGRWNGALPVPAVAAPVVSNGQHVDMNELRAMVEAIIAKTPDKDERTLTGVARMESERVLASSKAELNEKFEKLVQKVSEALVQDLNKLNQSLDSRIAGLALPPKATTIELLQDGQVQARIEGTHFQTPELLYWIQAKDVNGFRFPVMLFGKPGVSKSHTCSQVAQALGLTFGLISLNPQTPESRLFGYKDASGNYHRTQFRDAFENGGLFLIDEIDNASDALLTSLNSALANGHGAFPDGMIDRHVDFVCAATANTPGRGGDANHSGRRQLDAATINRFVCIDWQNDDELELLLAERINQKTGRVWLEWVRKVRVYCEANHPRVIVSPRSTMMGAKAILDSPFGIERIADMTLFKGLDKDTRTKILAHCPLPQVTGRQ